AGGGGGGGAEGGGRAAWGLEDVVAAGILEGDRTRSRRRRRVRRIRRIDKASRRHARREADDVRSCATCQSGIRAGQIDVRIVAADRVLPTTRVVDRDDAAEGMVESDTGLHGKRVAAVLHVAVDAVGDGEALLVLKVHAAV